LVTQSAQAPPPCPSQTSCQFRWREKDVAPQTDIRPLRDAGATSCYGDLRCEEAFWRLFGQSMFEDARRNARNVDSNLLNRQAQPESLIIANAGARLIRHHSQQTASPLVAHRHLASLLLGGLTIA
jgi:hypothetical protein